MDDSEHRMSSFASVELNKQVAREFIELAINEGKVLAAVARYVSNRFIQHDPRVRDGPEGMLERIMRTRIEHPQMCRAKQIRRVIAEGDLVAVHSLVTYSPGDRGTAVVDILRFEEGKIVEHWNVRQPVPETSANGNPMV